MTKEEALEYIAFQAEHDCFATKRAGKIYIKRVVSVPSNIPKEYFCDREFVEKAVKINGMTLALAPEELQRDKELILAAAKQCGSPSFYFYLKLPSELKADFEFMQKLLTLNGSFLKQIDFDWATPFSDGEKQLILTAIKQNYEVAEHIRIAGNFAFNNDKDFVLAAIQTDGRTLKFVGDNFRDDEDVVLAAASNTYRAFEYASYRLRTDENFILKLLDINPSCLAYAPRAMRENRALIERLFAIHPYVYRYAKGKIKLDIDFAVRAIRSDSTLCEFIERKVWDSKIFTEGLKALISDRSWDRKNYEYLKSRLRHDDRYEGLFNE